MKIIKWHVHRIILVRIVPAWILLSLFFGIFTYEMETIRINKFVFGLASDAVEDFNKNVGVEFYALSYDRQEEILQNILHKGQFVGISIYDKNRVLNSEHWYRADENLISKIKDSNKYFPIAGEHRHEIVKYGDDLYVMAMAPLKYSKGIVGGYFEGAYKVPSLAVFEMNDRIYESLATVLVALFVSGFIFYSVVFSLYKKSSILSSDLLESNFDLMEVLGSAIAKRDSDTDAHNYRVTLYSVMLAESLQVPKGEMISLISGAFLHDVGKIGIPDAILLKPGKLTIDEFEVMKSHVYIGQHILEKSKWLKGAQEIVSCHHERFDGKGYPNGLQGEYIPFKARLFSIVDVFDALTSVRPYKNEMSYADAVKVMLEEGGKSFDVLILGKLLEIAPGAYAKINKASVDILRGELESKLRFYAARTD